MLFFNCVVEIPPLPPNKDKGRELYPVQRHRRNWLSYTIFTTVHLRVQSDIFRYVEDRPRISGPQYTFLLVRVHAPKLNYQARSGGRFSFVVVGLYTYLLGHSLTSEVGNLKE